MLEVFLKYGYEVTEGNDFNIEMKIIALVSDLPVLLQRVIDLKGLPSEGYYELREDCTTHKYLGEVSFYPHPTTQDKWPTDIEGSYWCPRLDTLKMLYHYKMPNDRHSAYKGIKFPLICWYTYCDPRVVSHEDTSL